MFAALLLAMICAAFTGLIFSGQAVAKPIFKFKEAFGSAAQPSFTNPTGLAVDQANGDLLVMDQGAGTISRYKPDGSPDDFSALGTNVISATPGGPLSFAAANEAQIAVDNSETATDGNIYVTQGSPPVVSIFARTGAFLGNLSAAGSEPFGFVCGVSVGPDGDVYVGDFEKLGVHKFVPTANPPTNADAVAKFAQGGGVCTNAAGVASTAGSIFSAFYNFNIQKLDADTGVAAYTLQSETTTQTVAPGSGNLLVASKSEVIEYDASGSDQPVELNRFSVGSNVQGVAVGPSGATYISRAGQGQLEVWEQVPVPTVATTPATNVSLGEATLNGSVNPEGAPLTGCKFEYGLTTSGSFEAEVPCNPPAASISPDFATHPVSADLTGLQPNGTYRFRLTATNANGTTSGSVVTFGVNGPPQITEVRAINADQTSLTLEAKVNPRGFQTNYFFEWGPTPAYGNRIPASLFEPSAGAGNQPVLATVPVSGLAPASGYHYRVVARNSAGTTVSADHVFETLNSCGLPDHRCFELASPRDPGPVASTGTTLEAGADIEYQAATGGSGAIAYDVEHGLPGATRGADVLYLGRRGPDGWTSAQLSAPILVQNDQTGPNSNSSTMLFLNDELSCGFIATNQPLTPNPTMNFVREAGGGNLYRVNPNGSYTPVSTLPPQNSLDNKEFAYSGVFRNEYQVMGASQDCRKVVFRTPYNYPGLASEGDSHLYEWEDGEFRNIAPEGAGKPAPVAVPGTNANHFNVVSRDGSRTFFSANRITAPNPAEVGANGIFVRDAAGTRDVSTSETGTPSLGVTYQYATPDGSRVFFTANAGLTAASSSSGTDLYEYNLTTEDLTDLSVEPEPGGAQVGGFVGASANGSHVYFAARGQLLPGRGSTLADNISSGTYSLYGVAGGVVSFVGTVRADELNAFTIGGITVGEQEFWTSRVSPSGRFLLFETSANFTGYYSGSPQVREAYLYDDGSKSVTCVSCRQDGQASVASAEGTFFHPLPFAGGTNPLHSPLSLVEASGQAKVFFRSRDRLATGALNGPNTIYQWSHDQVFKIVTEPQGLSAPGAENSESRVRFDGASADGTDLYIGTPESLTWEDTDGRPSLYDARVGGGFPPPPAPPSPCNPTLEGSCQSPATQPPSGPSPASATFNGPGNEKPKKNKKKNGNKKKDGKKGKGKNGKKGKQKKGKGKNQSGKKKNQGKKGRDANGNRRAGK